MANGKLRTRKGTGKGCCHKERARLVRRDKEETEIVRYQSVAVLLLPSVLVMFDS